MTRSHVIGITLICNALCKWNRHCQRASFIFGTHFPFCRLSEMESPSSCKPRHPGVGTGICCFVVFLLWESSFIHGRQNTIQSPRMVSTFQKIDNKSTQWHQPSTVLPVRGTSRPRELYNDTSTRPQTGFFFLLSERPEPGDTQMHSDAPRRPGDIQETSRRHTGDTQETPRRHPRAPRRLPGDSQETPRRHP